MAQCKAKTKKGARCRRPALDGADFCTTHKDATSETDAARESSTEADLGETVKTLLGVTALGSIVYAALKFGKRF